VRLGEGKMALAKKHSGFCDDGVFDSTLTQAVSDQLSSDTATLMGSIVMPMARLSSLMLCDDSSIYLVTNHDVARVASLTVSTPLAN
jgi:hypothetical protein